MAKRPLESLLLACGTTHLTAARVSHGAGAVSLTALHETPVEADPSREEAWWAGLAQAFTALKGQGLKGAATLILPPSLVLTKILTVPRVDPARQWQTITYEAFQNLPYEFSEVAWDAHVLEDDGIELTVLLCASRRDNVEEICRIAERSGFVLGHIAAPAACELNALRLTGDDAEPVALLNIGARGTGLTISGTDSPLLRNLALGGNNVTQQFADALHKPVEAAESQKRVLAHEGDEEVSEAVKDAWHSASQAFLRRLTTDLTRTLATFRRQHDGASPQRILLTGFGAMLPGIEEALSTRFKVPVETFDATVGLAPDAKLDPELLELAAPHLSEISGVAAALSDPEAAQIDLLPAQRKEARDFAQRKLWLLAAAALFALAPLFPFLHYSGEAAKLKGFAEDRENANLPPRLHAATIDDLRGQLNELALFEADLRSLANVRFAWNDLLVDLQERLVEVEDVWVEDLRLIAEEEAIEPTDLFGTGELSVTLPDGSLLFYDAGLDQWFDEAQNEVDAPRPEVSLKLFMRGRIVDRENPLARSSTDLNARIDALLQAITESAFVTRVEDENYLYTDQTSGVLPFEFTLVVNPESPL